MLRTETNPIAQGPASRRRRIAAGLTHALSCCLLVLPFACVEPALALEPTTALASYGRQAWVMENGLPQNTVQALAQTRDGFIWLGTEVGLVRFDGNGFMLFDQNSKPGLPGNDVRCLLATDDGALWIGTSDGLARLNDGAVTTFTTSNGLPGNSIRSLHPGQQGNVIVTTDIGEVSVEGSRFESVHHAKLQGTGVLFEADLADKAHVVVHRTTLEVDMNGHAAALDCRQRLPRHTYSDCLRRSCRRPMDRHQCGSRPFPLRQVRPFPGDRSAGFGIHSRGS